MLACNQPADTNKAKAGDTGVHAAHKPAADAEDYITALEAGEIAEDTLKGSPMRIAMGDIGNSHLHIAYSAPGVKGRVIWGGLVAYNKVWVTGAHKATCVIFTEPLLFGGKQVPAGAYALFTIPREKEAWTVILNKNYDQHQADDYDEREDILRVAITPAEQDTLTQRLTYTVANDTKDKGSLNIRWEKKQLTIPLQAL